VLPFFSTALHFEQLLEYLAVIFLGSFLYIMIFHRCPADLFWHLARHYFYKGASEVMIKRPFSTVT
jgi:hypothetical protein